MSVKVSVPLYILMSWLWEAAKVGIQNTAKLRVSKLFCKHKFVYWQLYKVNWQNGHPTKFTKDTLFTI